MGYERLSLTCFNGDQTPNMSFAGQAISLNFPFQIWIRSCLLVLVGVELALNTMHKMK